MAELAAIVGGIEGPKLSESERAFFREANPWGYILFQRNCVSRAQVRRLTDELKDAAGRADLPILIDEEGGRVQRLKPPEWRARAPMRAFGALWERNPESGLEALRLNTQILAQDLAELGITVDCVPCVDVPVPGSHQVIGDRAFSADPEMVGQLGRIVVEAMEDAGVLPVIKHIPGHGRASVDSHDALPRVSASHAELSQSDFLPFKALNDAPMAMTAHVVYEAIDPEACATLSQKLIGQVIRAEIGFDGLLMSDDLSMKALAGSLAERGAGCLRAGCDVALHCNGTVAEMSELAAGLPQLVGAAKKRADAVVNRINKNRSQISLAEAEQRLKELMA